MTTSSNYSWRTDLILTTRTTGTLPLLPRFIIAKASMNSIGETFLLAEKAMTKEAHLFTWHSHRGVKSLHLKFSTLQAGPTPSPLQSSTGPHPSLPKCEDELPYLPPTLLFHTCPTPLHILDPRRDTGTGTRPSQETDGLSLRWWEACRFYHVFTMFIMFLFQTTLNNPTNLWRKNPACGHSPIATLTLTIARIVASHRPQRSNMVKLTATARRLGLQGASWGIGPYHDLVVVHQLRWDLMKISNRKLTSLTWSSNIIKPQAHLKWKSLTLPCIAISSPTVTTRMSRVLGTLDWPDKPKLQDSASFASPSDGSKANAAIDASCHQIMPSQQ